MLLFVLKDGAKYGITDHNKDIDFNLPEDGDDITYSAKSGFQISDVQNLSNLDPGSYEVTGPIGDVVTLPQLLGGRWRDATTYLFEVDWKNPLAAIDLMKGLVMKTGPKGGDFRFEVLDERCKLAQVIGRVITNQCPRNFAACCVNIAPEIDTTVDSITDLLTITLATSMTAANYIGGRMTFTSGPLSGNDPVEIFGATDNGDGTSTFVLFEPLVDFPDVGDDVTIKEGCDGTIQTCATRFSNGVNNRGFAATPGNTVLQPAIPGQGN